MTKKCRGRCKQEYQTFEEKETDVNIALTILSLAFQKEFDKILMLSGDSDFVPIIKSIQSLFPNKKTHLVIPINGKAESLKRVMDQYSKIKLSHIRKSLFPDRIEKTYGFIKKPDEW